MSQVSNCDCRQTRDEQLTPSDAVSCVRKCAAALIHYSIFCTQNLDNLLLCGSGGSLNAPGLVGHRQCVDIQLGRYSSSYRSSANFTINRQCVSIPKQ